MSYLPAERRYSAMTYRRAGRSGVQLPAVSLGLWHNFGDVDSSENARQMLLRAFDLGIMHFDLANNYGPPPGSAESTFGRVLQGDLAPYRDELLISTKAGYTMWPGPHGDWGSRKSLLSSLDASLKRLGLEYVDIFYHHRPDPNTPLEETMSALDAAVRSGRALYVGLSNYSAEQTRRAAALLQDLGTPLLIHQPKYSMYERWIEGGLLETLAEVGAGCIAFSPLAQGRLTDRYLKGIPGDSRAASGPGFLRPEHITDSLLAGTARLNALAHERGQTLAQMALSWVLRTPGVTSALIGASRVSQIEDAAGALAGAAFSQGELEIIEGVLREHPGI
ncbi:aldo/keto reductase [Deinococcus sp.]|uniref:aldo/keto reductase n=1 Tax=Deinococcus sp. TaxID=47478 RepID=UPI003CC5C2DA